MLDKNLIYFVVITASFIITIKTLQSADGGDVRSVFVFIAPCALDGISQLTSLKKDDRHQDCIEIILSVLGILFTGIFVLLAIFDVDVKEYEQWIAAAIAVYPVKYFSNSVFDFIHLLQERESEG